MPKIEIERKFLLKALPNIVSKDSVKIDQYYMRNSSGVWERVRKWESNFGTKFIHTVKKNISKLENLEDEKDISEDEYQEFTKKCLSGKEDSKFIKKIRHIYPDGNLNWEVDEFDNGYQLIVAEVEIPSKSFKLKVPDFIKSVSLLEVTGLKQFSNRSLSLDIVKNHVEIR
jgi:CYTH domain-containing protein